jgi:hypothetical protein
MCRFAFGRSGCFRLLAPFLGRRFFDLVVCVLVQGKILIHGSCENKYGCALSDPWGFRFLQLIWTEKEGIAKIITLFVFE